MFLFHRKNKEDKLYPSFITRTFAAVIDILLATIIIIPVCNLLYSVIYKDLPPSKELAKIVERVYQNSTSFEEAQKKLESDESYQTFMQTHGYMDIMLEQSLQVLILGILILFFWVKTQSTPGKMLLSMKIVTNDHQQKPTIVQYVIRLISYPISILPLGLGVFYILVNKKRRAFHDIIAGTVVISQKHLK